MVKSTKHFKFILWNWLYLIFTIFFKIYLIVAPYFIFTFILNENLTFFWVATTSFLGVRIFNIFLDFMNQAYFKGFLIFHKMKLAEKIANFLKKTTYKKYNENSSGFYYSEIENTIEKSVSQFYANLLSFLQTLSIILMTLGLFFYINWILALIIVGVITFFVITTSLLSKKLTKLQSAKLQAISDFNNSLSTYLLTLPQLKTLNSDDKFEFIINKRNKKNWITREKYGIFSDLISFFNEYSNNFFSAIITIGIAFWTLYYKNNNSSEIVFANISLIVLVQLSFSEFFANAKTLFNNYPAIISGWKNIKNFEQKNKLKVENLEENLQNLEGEISSILIENLNFYLPDRKLFNNLTFKIEKGKKYIIQGVNGSGKSTLARILLGVEKEFQGKIIVNNHFDIKDLSPFSLNNHINYVYNNPGIIYGTILENISLLEPEKNKNPKEILENINLQNFSLQDSLDENNSLSTGQIQKIHLARSLYSPKEILIIDEGLSNLDKENYDKILLKLLDNKDLTIILITHHLNNENLNLFDQVINLNV